MTTASRATRSFVERYPGLKAALKALIRPFRAETSADYVELEAGDREATAVSLKEAWRAAEIPQKQRSGVDRLLADYRAGHACLQFDALVDMLRPLTLQASRGDALTVLEVGCSSGYYSEVFAIKGLDVRYAGCDYSEAFVQMARRIYPALDFRVEDATALRYADASHDVVVSGGCLLHIPDYEAAIREAARVARRYVVFHRTPVLHRRPTTYFTKRAYGVKTVEIHFNEQELVQSFARHGLYVIDITTLDTDWRDGDAYATKSYLCEKAA